MIDDWNNAERYSNIPFSSLSFPSWDRRRIDREDKEYNRVVRMGGNIYMIEYSH